jgi:hypothetical protein
MCCFFIVEVTSPCQYKYNQDFILQFEANFEWEYKNNPLKPALVFILFKNPVRTSKRTPHFTITKINWLTLFKEVIAVYMRNIV